MNSHFESPRKSGFLTRNIISSVRMEKWLPEDRSLEGVIALPQLDSAASIVVAADSVIRALQKNRIDQRRAAMLSYALQTSLTACRLTNPRDPDLRLAGHTLFDLNLELSASKSDNRAQRRFS